MMSKTFRIQGMHCSSCAVSIDLELEEMAGVGEAKTNYARGLTTVAFDPSIIKDSQIIGVIAKLGYIAQVEG